MSSLAFLRRSPLGGKSSILHFWGLLFRRKQWNTFTWLVKSNGQHFVIIQGLFLFKICCPFEIFRVYRTCCSNVPLVTCSLSHVSSHLHLWLRLAEIRGKAGKGTGLSMPATRFEQIQTTNSCKSMQSRGNHIVMYVRTYIYVYDYILRDKCTLISCEKNPTMPCACGVS